MKTLMTTKERKYKKIQRLLLTIFGIGIPTILITLMTLIILS